MSIVEWKLKTSEWEYQGIKDNKFIFRSTEDRQERRVVEYAILEDDVHTEAEFEFKLDVRGYPIIKILKDGSVGLPEEHGMGEILNARDQVSRFVRKRVYG